MVFISINVNGLNEAVEGLNSAVGGLSSARTRILQQASQFMANELKRNAHVITGRMRDSVQVRSVSDKMAVVSVTAPYAVYENARVGGKQGPHDFADRAEEATRNMLPDSIQENIGDLFKKTIKKPFKYTHKTIGKGGRTVYHYGKYSRSTSGFRTRTDTISD